MSDFDDDSVYERDHPRENFSTKMEIRIDEQWRECVLINISASGAKLYLGQSISRGKEVLIRFAEIGEYEATVAWSNGDEAGIKFDHDPDEMNRMILQLESRG